MKLCFFTPAYPGRHNSSDFVFVKQLVDAIAEKGHECYVIAPYNFLHYRRFSAVQDEYRVGDGLVEVYRPYYLSFSNYKGLQWVKNASFQYAIRKALSKLPKSIDAVYGHFWSAGYWGYHFAKNNNLPLFVATGESSIKKLFHFPKDLKDFSDYVKGVICVSGKNRDESIRFGLTTTDKCQVFPNAVNTKLFYKHDKKESRKKLGLPQDAFIVAFVGWFIHRKGAVRVAEAISRLNNVKSVFIGQPAIMKSAVNNEGNQEPQCEGILFKGVVPHDNIPQYLSAADCFVLPTLNEGCCNAVVEALSCGLPVISSNLPFNWDVLDESNSIMIDPMSIDEITEAIKKLRDDAFLCAKLSNGALEKAKALTINKRADAIIDFIQSKIIDYPQNVQSLH